MLRTRNFGPAATPGEAQEMWGNHLWQVKSSTCKLEPIQLDQTTAHYTARVCATSLVSPVENVTIHSQEYGNPAP